MAAEATRELATKSDLAAAVRDFKIWWVGVVITAMSILFAALHYIPPER